jgi:hypothetical protein
MNFKRKNKTNRSLEKKNSIRSSYYIPKDVRRILSDTKNNQDIHSQLDDILAMGIF